jgi:hypothetical protein
VSTFPLVKEGRRDTCQDSLHGTSLGGPGWWVGHLSVPAALT